MLRAICCRTLGSSPQFFFMDSSYEQTFISDVSSSFTFIREFREPPLTRPSVTTFLVPMHGVDEIEGVCVTYLAT